MDGLRSGRDNFHPQVSRLSVTCSSSRSPSSPPYKDRTRKTVEALYAVHARRRGSLAVPTAKPAHSGSSLRLHHALAPGPLRPYLYPLLPPPHRSLSRPCLVQALPSHRPRFFSPSR
ncbi:hypothetical protein GW17_00004891 [Ensete ventricosum]|nr:hypothetical protein GW17_00004891 [Ensete ventricosum]RZR77047.1 hypothetical protein BHM03_00002023 [Ensete ventricosum]